MVTALPSLLGAGPVEAQDVAKESPILSFSDAIDVRWVHIPAVVRLENELEQDLTISDFELWIDGKIVPIETFEHRSDTPLSTVYLQDLSGSMNNLGKLDLSRSAFDVLLNEGSARDEFSIVSFAGAAVTVEVPFSSDRESLRRTSSQWKALGTTALYDAVTWLPEISSSAKRSTKAAIVVTDGLDNTSEITPESSRERVIRTQLPVYVIDLSKFGHQRNPPTNPQDPSWPLRRLAHGTGGHYFRPLNQEALTRDTTNIAREIRLQYVLGFAADGTQEPSDHKIEIQVRGRKSEPRHRPEYFGPPPASFVSGD